MNAEFAGTPRFEIVRRLGAGGMGIVYEAVDRQRQQRVALKVLRVRSAHAVLLLKREFRALADLDHPNLVRLLELVQEGQQWFFTMELVEGTDLASWVSGGRPASASRTAPALAATEVDGPPAAVVPLLEDTLSQTPEIAPRLDVERLRRALPQLVRAIDALHQAGKVHRDIKPSNVRVAPDGRVVLLDFGLVYEPAEDPTEEHPVGTIVYMAPEQAAGRPLTPAADWYALGVLLYEALGGGRPFGGNWHEVLAAKQERDPPPLPPGAPEDSARLTFELLRRDPDARPRAPAILERLGAAPVEALPSPGRARFVGRRRELDLLAAAWAEVQGGQGGVVLVHGESGVGKSALVRQLADELRARTDDLVVLSGRYYQREMVPYRAFDAVLDSLVRFLMTQSAARAAAVMPTDAELLIETFPLLRDVDRARVPSAGLAGLESLDAHARRRRMFAAARDLFARLSRQLPTLILVDDVQWADADSRALFSEIMAAPAPPMLVVCTYRTSPGDAATIPRVVGWVEKLTRMRQLGLGGLPDEDAERLCRELLGAVDQTPSQLPRILQESGGHPLFLEVLCRAGETGGGETRLDDALAARADKLGPAAQDVLALCAVAGAGLPQEIVRLASGLNFDDLTRASVALCGANLLRATRQAHVEALEPFHDRVAESLLRRLAPERRAELHRRLAGALEAHDAEAPSPPGEGRGREASELLFRQWKGAGEAERAAGYATRAAAEAARVFAFDRAAALYREALELTPPGARQPLRVNLGDALAMAGRGPAAAEAYLAAADAAAEVDQRTELRRRAGEQLLRSGHIDQAMAVLREVLASVGFSAPPDPTRALLWFIARRAQLALRGWGYIARSADELPAAELRRIDLCWSVAGGLGLVDTIAGAYFQARHVLAALRAGEPMRVARALATEVCYSSVGGHATAKRTAMLWGRAQALAAEVGDPFTVGWARGAGGIAAMLEGRFADAVTICDQADAMLRTNVSGVAWELHTINFFRVWSLAYCGRLRDLARLVPAGLRDAEERGDLYGAAILMLGLSNLLPLAADQPEAARANVTEVMSRWSHKGFFVEHWWELLTLVMCDLYEGQGARALERIAERWPRMQKAMMFRVYHTRVEVVHLRARAYLSAAAAATGAERERLLGGAARDARELGATTEPWAASAARLTAGVILHMRGQSRAAAEMLDQAARGLEQQQLTLYAAAARRARGQMLARTPGAEGHALVASADERLRADNVRAPERLARLLIGADIV